MTFHNMDKNMWNIVFKSEEQKPYKFGMTRRQVNNDTI